MGQHEKDAQDKKDKRRAKAEKPPPWAQEGEAAEAVWWRDVDPLLVAYVVQAVCDAGASVQFTTSREGGALGVRVYDEGIKSKTEWARPNEDLDELMYRIADYYREREGEDATRW